MHDDLLRRLRELNPVPDPDRYVALGEPDWPADPVLRAVLEQASTNNHRPGTTRLGPGRDLAPEERPMPTLTPPRNDENAHPQHRSRRGWLLAAAAIVVVVLAAGGLFTMIGSLFDDAVIAPATTDPEPDAEQTSNDQAIEAAEAYIDARNTHDPERARELVTDTFVTSEVPDAYTLRTMELAFEVHEAFGFRYVDGTCEVGGPGPEIAGREQQTMVNCDYGWTSELQRITGDPPVPVTFLFHVEDGLIDRIHHNWNPSSFMPDVYDPWLAFLEEHHPEGRNDSVATHSLIPEPTRRFIDRAPEYLASYEEWVEEQKD
jgi:hypothetical protein